MAIQRLVGVYNADGSLIGEIAYLLGKVSGRAHCTLCDITHSPVRRKPAWDALMAQLPIPVTLVHRDERSPDVAALTRGLEPCIAAQDDDGTWRILVTDAELATCNGSVERFGDLVTRCLATADEQGSG
jgi:hypothetical protein